MTDSTGPKISSWAIRSIGLTPVKIVGREEVAVREVAVGRPRAAGHELALAPADLDVRADLLDAPRR